MVKVTHYENIIHHNKIPNLKWSKKIDIGLFMGYGENWFLRYARRNGGYIVNFGNSLYSDYEEHSWFYTEMNFKKHITGIKEETWKVKLKR